MIDIYHRYIYRSPFHSSPSNPCLSVVASDSPRLPFPLGNGGDTTRMNGWNRSCTWWLSRHWRFLGKCWKKSLPKCLGSSKNRIQHNSTNFDGYIITIFPTEIVTNGGNIFRQTRFWLWQMIDFSWLMRRTWKLRSQKFGCALTLHLLLLLFQICEFTAFPLAPHIPGTSWHLMCLLKSRGPGKTQNDNINIH